MTFDVGDVVEYETTMGRVRRCRVESRAEGIFDGQLLDPAGAVVGQVWGHDDQVLRVHKKSPGRLDTGP